MCLEVAVALAADGINGRLLHIASHQLALRNPAKQQTPVSKLCHRHVPIMTVQAAGLQM